MKTLLLSFGLGLVAVLQAQTLPTVVEEEQEMVTTQEKTCVSREQRKARCPEPHGRVPTPPGRIGPATPPGLGQAQGAERRVALCPSPAAVDCGTDPDFNQEALEDFANVTGAGGLNTENTIIPKQRGLRLQSSRGSTVLSLS
ncbi:von Ebner gland protein 2-like [Dipodomys spectabilis]|uniref:von Ebner gland protein 2-like n=1 Tax=Dipodomys spectabilis TaxID=105255 RepID=UPI001C538536|nr:von Ebner gland protein 2-like [Dipodomys spectabilis]